MQILLSNARQLHSQTGAVSVYSIQSIQTIYQVLDIVTDLQGECAAALAQHPQVEGEAGAGGGVGADVGAQLNLSSEVKLLLREQR